MPFGIKILVAVLSLAGILVLGTAAWGKLSPCDSQTGKTSVTTTDTPENATATGTTETDPCSSSWRNRWRNFHSTGNSRSITGGGTDNGK